MGVHFAVLRMSKMMLQGALWWLVPCYVCHICSGNAKVMAFKVSSFAVWLIIISLVFSVLKDCIDNDSLMHHVYPCSVVCDAPWSIFHWSVLNVTDYIRLFCSYILICSFCSYCCIGYCSCSRRKRPCQRWSRNGQYRLKKSWDDIITICRQYNLCQGILWANCCDLLSWKKLMTNGKLNF